MELEYIKAKYLGWASPRSTITSMAGYIGPVESDTRDLGNLYIKGEICNCYRLNIQPNGDCLVPDLTKNRKRLKKRVAKGLFKILSDVDLDAKSPCDILIKQSKIDEEKERLLEEIRELKAEKANKKEGNGVTVQPVTVQGPEPDVQSKKTPVRRGRKPGRKPKITATPEITETPDME